MSSDEAEKVRKTVSLTHKQLGATGLLGLAVALAPYLKETFVTRSEGVLVATQIEYMRKDIVSLQATVESSAVEIKNQIKESERRTGKTEERLERRIDNLEVALRMKSNKIN